MRLFPRVLYLVTMTIPGAAAIVCATGIEIVAAAPALAKTGTTARGQLVAADRTTS